MVGSYLQWSSFINHHMHIMYILLVFYMHVGKGWDKLDLSFTVHHSMSSHVHVSFLKHSTPKNAIVKGQNIHGMYHSLNLMISCDMVPAISIYDNGKL
jgi:hypothetical protein